MKPLIEEPLYPNLSEDGEKLNSTGQVSAVTNSIVLAITFSSTWTSYLGTTVIIGTEFGSVGATSYVLLYIVGALSGLIITPFLVPRLSARRSIPLGSSMQLVLLLGCITRSTWLMYAGSVMWGFGLALMMTAGGSYLSLSLTKETAGWHSGRFQLVLSSGTLFGNVANLLFLKFAKVTALFGFFIAMELCGVMVGCLLPKFLGDPDGTKPEMSLTIIIKGYKEVFQCRPYVLGIPLYIYTGMWLTHIFWFSNVFVGKSYGEGFTGAVMIGFAITPRFHLHCLSLQLHCLHRFDLHCLSLQLHCNSLLEAAQRMDRKFKEKATKAR